MSATTSTLPAGWSSILDEMHLRLDHAIAATNERIDQLPHMDHHALAQERRVEIAQWCERLQRLTAYLGATEQVVQSVDEVLANEETRLKQSLLACGTLKQKLAEATACAIG